MGHERLTPFRVTVGAPVKRCRGRLPSIAKALKQGFQLVGAAVNVANDVEGAVLSPPVVPERLAFYSDAVDLFNAAQNRDRAKPLALKPLETPLQVTALPRDDLSIKGSLRALLIAFQTHRFWYVEHDDCR